MAKARRLPLPCPICKCFKMRADLSSLPVQFKNYVDLVEDLTLFEALRFANERLLYTLSAVEESRGEHRYQPDKWTIKEVVVHVMDVERVFAYRALRFSRNDKTPLPSFEDNEYVRESNAHARTLKQLTGELTRLRQTTLDLYQSFSSTMLERRGTGGKAELSVLNLGFIIAGHEMHHAKILNERYLKRE